MFPMDRAAKNSQDTEQVTVEYTARGKRVRKIFPNMFAARSFYSSKYKAGAEPKVIGAKILAATQAEKNSESS